MSVVLREQGSLVAGGVLRKGEAFEPHLTGELGFARQKNMGKVISGR